MRRAKVDANHLEIVTDLRKAGCGVISLASLGKGIPDAVVFPPGSSSGLLFEFKDGAKVPSARQLTPDQEKWHKAWGRTVYVVKSTREALDVVQGKR